MYVMMFTPHTDSCAIMAGKYLYTKDLLVLEGIGSASTGHQDHIKGFLPAEAWEPFLKSHPDQTFAEFICRGIHFGFCIGFNSQQKLKPCKGTLQKIDNLILND